MTAKATMSEVPIRREWAMPNSSTFKIQPIRALLRSEINQSDGLWIDPFSGGTDHADVTNDLNPDVESDYTLDALEFLKRFDDTEVDGGVIYDPPYSPRQVKECYDNIGLEVTQEDTKTSFWADAREEIARVCDTGATVVSCGWNSGGIGKRYGFEITEILLVPHGGGRNDTIVTVENKTRSRLDDFK